jgi:hypothetical protein
MAEGSHQLESGIDVRIVNADLGRELGDFSWNRADDWAVRESFCQIGPGTNGFLRLGVCQNWHYTVDPSHTREFYLRRHNHSGSAAGLTFPLEVGQLIACE